MTITVKADYADAGMVRVLMVPPWVCDPTVLPRQDGKDVITVEVQICGSDRCLNSAEWRRALRAATPPHHRN